jgi:alkylhydroperoxidase family enzyme
MTWLAVDATSEDAFSAVFGLTPAVHQRYGDLEREIWDGERVSPVLLELCRLRIAHLVGDAGALERRTPQAAAAGLDAAKVAELAQWPTSPRFDAAERACLSFAESYVIDAHSVTDEQCADLNRHLSAEELAALTTAIAVFDAMSRFRVALDV